jgi:hypothetical protein
LTLEGDLPLIRLRCGGYVSVSGQPRLFDRGGEPFGFYGRSLLLRD